MYGVILQPKRIPCPCVRCVRACKDIRIRRSWPLEAINRAASKRCAASNSRSSRTGTLCRYAMNCGFWGALVCLVLSTRSSSHHQHACRAYGTDRGKDPIPRGISAKVWCTTYVKLTGSDTTLWITRRTKDCAVAAGQPAASLPRRRR